MSQWVKQTYCIILGCFVCCLIVANFLETFRFALQNMATFILTFDHLSLLGFITFKDFLCFVYICIYIFALYILFAPWSYTSHRLMFFVVNTTENKAYLILSYLILTYRKTSNISRTLVPVGNKIVNHSNVVGASPVGAAPTTSSFLT